MRIIGIDPGLTGGIADISESHAVVYPLSEGATVWDQLTPLLQRPPEKVVLEKQWPRPSQNAVAMGTMMLNYGCILTVLHAAGIEPVLVPPATWKKHYWPERRWPQHLTASQRTKLAKIESVNMALSIFPGMSLIEVGPKGGKTYHDGMAEALLLAVWGRIHG